MGVLLLDQFSYLHLSMGVAAYFWGLSLRDFIVIHIVFEILENTKAGVRFINEKISFWPGGKPQPDTLTNRLGDTISAVIGWISARELDRLGLRRGWLVG